MRDSQVPCNNEHESTMAGECRGSISRLGRWTWDFMKFALPNHRERPCTRQALRYVWAKFHPSRRPVPVAPVGTTQRPDHPHGTLGKIRSCSVLFVRPSTSKSGQFCEKETKCTNCTNPGPLRLGAFRPDCCRLASAVYKRHERTPHACRVADFGHRSIRRSGQHMLDDERS